MKANTMADMDGCFGRQLHLTISFHNTVTERAPCPSFPLPGGSTNTSQFLLWSCMSQTSVDHPALHQASQLWASLTDIIGYPRYP